MNEPETILAILAVLGGAAYVMSGGNGKKVKRAPSQKQLLVEELVAAGVEAKKAEDVIWKIPTLGGGG